MKLEIIYGFVLIMILASLQYTLNKILVTLKNIEKNINEILVNSNSEVNNERRNIIK
ncbi:cation:proton antiporter [Finegoldia magna]|uniref:cation:proton antiporter n=1 Tax=Finegoldia magna TaxID=1260 RepID=UPI000B91B72F|nr:cation:proton antiporter [Finegoldia magna]OXZ30673.1 cation:proton antiporter [Finegoldia magna]